MSQGVHWVVKPDVALAELDHEVGLRTRDMAKRVFNGVVRRSPVYTGSFRASWRAKLNVPDYSITNGGSPGAPMLAPSFPSLGRLKAGDLIYITNSQPYAYRLEYGWSKKAPAGVLRAQMASMRV